MCVETFAEYPPLGRFAVRDMRQVSPPPCRNQRQARTLSLPSVQPLWRFLFDSPRGRSEGWCYHARHVVLTWRVCWYQTVAVGVVKAVTKKELAKKDAKKK
eukprot:2458118-Rhodomonas_salina.1